MFRYDTKALDALTRGKLQQELLRICEATRQTVFMITHDVDEAVLLADRIFLMTTGPRARLAASLANRLPHPRRRETLHHLPEYAALRGRLLDHLLDNVESETASTVEANKLAG